MTSDATDRNTAPTESGTTATPAAAAPARRERAWWEPVPFGPGQLLALVGAIGLFVSCFLEWISDGVLGAGAHASDVPVEFLWDRAPESGDPSLLIVLIPIALLAAVGSLWGLVTAGVRLLAGLAGFVVVGLFAYQLARTADEAGDELGDALGVGWYVGVVGALLVFVAAFVPTPWTVRRRVEEVPPAAERGV